jgi:methyltransferase (TIGR00027 family)
MTTVPAEVPRAARLAMTAWWTAAARARETRRQDRLFDDEWAAMLAGAQSAEDYDRIIEGDAVDDLHAVTTRFFDDLVLIATHEHAIRQVVLIACGLDTRAYRLAWPTGTRVFELDQPHVIAYKNCLLTLNGARAACRREPIGVDLNRPFEGHLTGAGFDPSAPTIWVAEQCLYFFERTAAQALLQEITRLSAPGSRLGFDIVNDDMVTSPATRAWADRMAAAGAPWSLTPEDPESLLDDAAWTTTVVEPGSGPADFGRYPYPLTPRSERQPRLFLVTSSRREA